MTFQPWDIIIEYLTYRCALSIYCWWYVEEHPVKIFFPCITLSISFSKLSRVFISNFKWSLNCATLCEIGGEAPAADKTTKRETVSLPSNMNGSASPTANAGSEFAPLWQLQPLWTEGQTFPISFKFSRDVFFFRACGRRLNVSLLYAQKAQKVTSRKLSFDILWS